VRRVGLGELHDLHVDEADGPAGGENVVLARIRAALGRDDPDPAGRPEQWSQVREAIEIGAALCPDDDEVRSGFRRPEAGERLVLDSDDADAQAGLEAQLVRQRARVANAIGPASGDLAELELRLAAGPRDPQDAVGGVNVANVTEGDAQADVAANEKLLALEQRPGLGGIAAKANRAASFLADRRTLRGRDLTETQADGSGGPDVRLSVPARDAGRPVLARVVLADEVEVAVRRPQVPRRRAFAATVLEAVIALTTLHT
jgi:hypothetical protein